MDVRTPAARKTDPETSHAAAEGYAKSGKQGKHCLMCLDAVKNNPGKSSARIGKITGLGRYEAARRLADLKGASVRQGDPEPCDLCNNRLCVTWWPDEAL